MGKFTNFSGYVHIVVPIAFCIFTNHWYHKVIHTWQFARLPGRLEIYRTRSIAVSSSINLQPQP